MPTLNLQQTELGANRYRVTASCDLPSLTLRPSVEFGYQLNQADQEAIRWYLEEYLAQPFDPNPKIATRTEQRMSKIGVELFQTIFSEQSMSRWWGRISDQLNDMRIEISTSIAAATAIPWELLRDPHTDTTLALKAAEFVRSQRDVKCQPYIPQPGESIRILLVICRPQADQDVPFRSVASQLVRGLNEDARRQIELNVLRPPTFAQLSRTLRDAKDAGQPFHVVHFDGHGLYADAASIQDSFGGLDTRRFDAGRSGAQGFLLFEKPDAQSNSDPIDGKTIGTLLANTNTPVLVLNACRSAHADTAQPAESSDGPPADTARAFGSLAQEVMDAGVAGVVAMRYNLWVVTATQFVYELYRNLVRGHSLGAAVSRGRKQLHSQPGRRIAYQSIDLQDWPVPVVFEAAPIRLLEQAQQTGDWRLQMGESAGHSGSSQLPAPPDIGFIGRDETLLALDRAFDRDCILLLHAYAGSGKTAAAAEFARWYQTTGGLPGGRILFTSFETYKPLYQVLGDLGEAFADTLEQNGNQWGALATLEQCRRIALQLMQQIPLLWIWDNLEPVAGFPEGVESAWSVEERTELLDFLRMAKQTQARFILTSRREERAWLGDLPSRIKLPPMPMTERAVFAEALASKRNQRLALADWRPLLRFSQGNPLTLLVVVRQALAAGLNQNQAIQDFVHKLQSGEAEFADEHSEKRDRSLAASLQYGFENAFDGDQQGILALLVYFQGFVDVDVLKGMGDSETDWSLPALQGQSREQLIALLDRAADIGLLQTLRGGDYHIHPALPWFFRRLFEQFYPDQTAADATVRAFCAAMGKWGNHYHGQYVDGHREVIRALRAEEANLLHAWRLTRQHGLWDALMRNMQGLHVLYDHTGRRAEWADLVNKVLPDLVAEDGGPLPGREAQWSVFTQYRVLLAEQDRHWDKAQRLQQRRVEWSRAQATPLLKRPVESLEGNERNRIRTLAVSLHELGEIQREQQKPVCVTSYKASLNLMERIGETAGAAICAFNLGHAYMYILTLRDLSQAEQWYQHSLELHPENDHQGRAGCFAQLGAVAWERAEEEAKANQNIEAFKTQIVTAWKHYHDALNLLPEDAVNDLSVAHMQLGSIYGTIGQIELSLQHYQENIRLRENSSNHYDAAQTRFNAAVHLLRANRHADALDYAKAALTGYQHYGERAQDKIDKTEALIREIQAAC